VASKCVLTNRDHAHTTAANLACTSGIALPIIDEGKRRHPVIFFVASRQRNDDFALRNAGSTI
jgi:hypothetical protein